MKEAFLCLPFITYKNMEVGYRGWIILPIDYNLFLYKGQGGSA